MGIPPLRRIKRNRSADVRMCRQEEIILSQQSFFAVPKDSWDNIVKDERIIRRKAVEAD